VTEIEAGQRERTAQMIRPAELLASGTPADADAVPGPEATGAGGTGGTGGTGVEGRPAGVPGRLSKNSRQDASRHWLMPHMPSRVTYGPDEFSSLCPLPKE
jgi:hypothetical protein